MDTLDLARPFLVAALGVAALTPCAMWLAHRVDAVDRPKADRWSRRVTPLLGGIAITAGLVLALLVGGLGTDVSDDRVVAVIGGVLGLHLVGLWDDLRGVPPAGKLAAQVAAAGILMLGGVRAGWPEPPLLAVPLTVVWVVGLTNALNLLDNMDGLAAGIAGICGLAVAGCAATLPGGFGAPAILVAVATAGAGAGFLLWNRHPARVFMGDSGSLPLGFALAAASLLATHREAGHLMVVLAGPLLALAVPILDTTFVSLLRKWHGRRISQGGRDHLSHRLVALGIPESRAVGLLWLVAAVFGLFAVVTSRMDFLGTYVLLGLGLIVACVLGVVLGRVKVYQATDLPAEAARTEEFRRTMLNYLRAAAPVAADFVLAGVAYVGAYLLRYDGRVPTGERELLEESVLAVVGAQLCVLAAHRVYRTVWRFFGVREAVALARAVVVAGGVTALIVAFGWRHAPYSRAVLLLNPVLLGVLLFGARAAARFLSDAFGSFPADGVRVLVVGAGDAGNLCLRALRARGGDPVTPVGFLDDDRTLARRRIHGVPVLGSVADLDRVLGELAPEEVVLSSLPEEEQVAELRRTVGRHGARLTLSPYARAFVPL